MALSANDNNVRTRVPGQYNPQIADAEEVYNGAYMGAGNRDHATSATRGRALPFNDAAGYIPLGFSLSRETGDTSASPIDSARVASEAQIRRVAVTGLGGTVADNFRLVYATDDGTFNLTRGTVSIPVGWVVEFDDSSNAWVEFFSARELAVLAMGGAAQYTWFLGVVSGILSVSGNMLTGITAPHHGRILSVYGIVIEAHATTVDDIDVNLEIGGTNVTGGLIQWTNAAAGTKLSGSAVTAENVFNEGDLIDVEGTVNNAGTQGLLGVYAEILCEPGL
jgi:hypothetical protein